MKTALLQFTPEFGKIKRNLEKIENYVKTTQAKLIVLPELCTTGYQFVSREETENLCEPIPDSFTVKAFETMCKEAGIYITAGIAEKDGETLYNSSVLVGPKGFIGKYRKVHLFREEKKWFSPGNIGFSVWDIGETKIGMMICFDWIFPEAARSLALQGAEVICQPVNLVLPFCQEAMITRAIENGIFVITANRTGTEQRGGKDSLTFTGQSQIVNPRGEVLFRLGEKNEYYQEVDINPGESRDKYITPENHILKDRKPDQYSLD